MILRSITQHFKDQNWFAIGLDFLIVVFGVFAGLQVNDWNTERQNLLLERDYVERIFVDMEKSVEDRTSDAQWDEERQRTQQIVLSALRSGELQTENRNDFDTGLLLFGYVNEPRVRWATVEEIQSTGSTTIIRDVWLRDEIARLQSEIVRRKALNTSLTETINVLREKISHRFEIVDFDYSSESAATLNYDFGALAEETDVLNLLSQIDYFARTKSSNADNLASAIDAFRLELDQRRNEKPIKIPAQLN
jgi:hypothetical protein